MHKTLLSDADFERVSKALKDEMDLENKIAQHLRDKRLLLNGRSYQIVRWIVVYDRGRSPGLVWDRERYEEERTIASGS
jgi:hypothetical protein